VAVLKPPDACLGAGRFILPDNGNGLRGGNIVAAVEKWRQFDSFPLGEYFFPALGLCKASAHGWENERRKLFFQHQDREGRKENQLVIFAFFAVFC